MVTLGCRTQNYHSHLGILLSVSPSIDAILCANPGIPELSESDIIPIIGGLCPSLKGFPDTTALINGSSAGFAKCANQHLSGSPSASSDLVLPAPRPFILESCHV